MQYQSYFNLSLHHSFYHRPICPDLVLAPTLACQCLLKGHRLVLKPGVNGLQLLIPIGPDQRPVLPLDESLILTFLLKLKKPDFASFTQLESQYQPGRSLYVFSNEENNDPGDLALRPTIVQFQRLLQIAMEHASSEPESSTHPPLENISPLEVRCAAIAELKTTQRGQIFGLVEIHHRGFLVQDFSQNIEFTIPFSAKERVWSYYLVTDQATPANSFSILDQGTEDPENRLQFSVAQSDLDDRVLASIQQRFPESRTVLLRSDAPVVCREIGRPNLQLIKAGHAKPWIPHLPNPPNQHGTQVINLLDDL